jgi:hypothetical protein
MRKMPEEFKFKKANTRSIPEEDRSVPKQSLTHGQNKEREDGMHKGLASRVKTEAVVRTLNPGTFE